MIKKDISITILHMEFISKIIRKQVLHFHSTLAKIIKEAVWQQIKNL